MSTMMHIRHIICRDCYITMGKTNRTKLAQANTSNSLRATVPSHIIQALGAKPGDEIEWSLRPDGDRFAVDVDFHRQ